jgi:hypothetical protein
MNDHDLGISLNFSNVREHYYSPFSLYCSRMPQLEGKKKSFFSDVYEEDNPRGYKIIFDPIENRMYPSFEANQYKLTSSASKLHFRLHEYQNIWIKIQQENKNVSSAQTKIVKKQRCFRCLRCCTWALITLFIFILMFLLLIFIST